MRITIQMELKWTKTWTLAQVHTCTELQLYGPRVFAAIYFVDSRFITRNIEIITYSLSNVLDNQSQET